MSAISIRMALQAIKIVVTRNNYTSPSLITLQLELETHVLMYLCVHHYTYLSCKELLFHITEQKDPFTLGITKRTY